jgi:hypothetical protein
LPDCCVAIPREQLVFPGSAYGPVHSLSYGILVCDQGEDKTVGKGLALFRKINPQAAFLVDLKTKPRSLGRVDYVTDFVPLAGQISLLTANQVHARNSSWAGERCEAVAREKR